MSKASRFADEASKRPVFHPTPIGTAISVTDAGNLFLKITATDRCALFAPDEALRLRDWLTATFDEEAGSDQPR